MTANPTRRYSDNCFKSKFRGSHFFIICYLIYQIFIIKFLLNLTRIDSEFYLFLSNISIKNRGFLSANEYLLYIIEEFENKEINYQAFNIQMSNVSFFDSLSKAFVVFFKFWHVVQWVLSGNSPLSQVIVLSLNPDLSHLHV